MSAICCGAMKFGFPVRRQYSSNEMPMPFMDICLDEPWRDVDDANVVLRLSLLQ